MHPRALVITLGVVLSIGGSAHAQLVDAVKVETGLVKGTVEDGLSVFRGIPYAAAPVGNLRWRAPQPPAQWPGVRTVTDYGRRPRYHSR